MTTTARAYHSATATALNARKVSQPLYVIESFVLDVFGGKLLCVWNGTRTSRYIGSSRCIRQSFSCVQVYRLAMRHEQHKQLLQQQENYISDYKYKE